MPIPTIVMFISMAPDTRIGSARRTATAASGCEMPMSSNYLSWWKKERPYDNDERCRGRQKVEKIVASAPLPCLQSGSNLLGKGAIYIETSESDHDRGGFGQRFEPWGLRTQKRDDVGKHDGELDTRILEINESVFPYGGDGFNSKRPGRSRPGLFFGRMS